MKSAMEGAIFNITLRDANTIIKIRTRLTPTSGILFYFPTSISKMKQIQDNMDSLIALKIRVNGVEKY